MQMPPSYSHENKSELENKYSLIMIFIGNIYVDINVQGCIMS